MKKLISILAFLVFLLAGCGTTDSAIYRYPTLEVEGMDVVKGSYSQSFQLWEDIFSGLYRVNDQGELIPEIATDMTISDDETVYTITLDKEHYWVDNTGEIVQIDGVDQYVTAYDFEFAWKRAVDPATGGGYSFIFEPILNATSIIANEKDKEELGVVALDESTLEITLAQPTPYFTSLLSFGTLYPVSEAAVSQFGDDYGMSAETTWYNGPFYVSAYDSGYEINLLKNENYPNADQVELNGVNYRTMEDITAQFNAFSSGEVDYTPYPTKEDYTAGLEDGSATDALTSYMFYVYFNNSESSLLNDINLRKALYYGFDRDSITENLYGDKNQPIEYIIPRNLTTSSYNLEYRDYAKDSYVTYDPELATEYLNTYMTEHDITDPSTIELEYITSDTEAGKKTAEAIKAQYEQTLGITINITTMPSLAFYDAVDAGNFDIQVGGWGADYADPSSYFSIWQTSSIGQVNGAYYSNPEYDQAYLEANAITDPEERMKAFAELEQMLADDAAFIPFYQKNEAYAESEDYESTHLLFQKVSNMYTTYSGDVN